MLFNSIDFAVFLPIVFILYWAISGYKLRAQNLFLLGCSYVFYGWWDWKFLLLILFSSVADFSVGLGMTMTTNLGFRKYYLWLSIILNLGLLGFFKYYNFFVENFIEAFSIFGARFSPSTLNIVLPVGISFYTFQTLSYTIDVYRNQIKPTRDFISFAAFVSFFPQLVAGPIERATHFLPQFSEKRTFHYKAAVDGLRQILWGLFKKVVIADNCAVYVNLIFGNSNEYSGAALVFGAVLFAFQIYGDFSGYSDIAIGTARLFGFNLMRNFNFPYFSRDIAEFWRRWHISLSTWFRDYLYIPLGGSKGKLWLKIRNTVIIFLVSGFWHGASWNFIVWGAIHALFFIPLIIRGKNRTHIEIVAKNKMLPSIKETAQIFSTFSLTVLAWVFFRADNLSHSLAYLKSMLLGMFYKLGYLQLIELLYWDIGVVLPALFLIFLSIEWIGRTSEHAIQNLFLTQRRVLRYCFYYLLIFSIFWFGQEEQEFIYFQF